MLALTPLALDTPGSDENREIKGAALDILWPKHITAQDLFEHLTAPNESYYGAYTAFLTRTLPETLTRDDLPVALAWATDFVRSANHQDDLTRRKLTDAILLAAWTHIQDPGITPAVVGYAQAAIGALYELFGGHDREDHDAFRKRVAEDAAGRRAFLRAALATPHNRTFAFSLSRSGLLLREDLAQRHLDDQAQSLSVGFIVRAVVLDCHAP